MEYRILESSNEIANAHDLFLKILQKNATKQGKINAGFQGGTNVTNGYWFESEDIWCGSQMLDRAPIPRYWNACGYGQPDWESVKSSEIITCEINMPLVGAKRMISGAFVIDESGTIFLAHDGGIGGGKPGIGKDAFLQKYSQNYKSILANDSKGKRETLLLSPLDSKGLIENLAKFVHDVSNFKEGKQETQYFLVQISDYGSNQILNGFYEHLDWEKTILNVKRKILKEKFLKSRLNHF